MSYSYLKSVFPDFAAAKSYNEPIYGMLAKVEPLVVQPSDSEMTMYAQTLINENKKSLKVEEFSNEKESDCSGKCEEYMKHILDCPQCKELLLKQLKVDNDKVVNEEIMEVVSYIAFGVFVLLVLDNMKKR
jgi:hypothetical protein